MTLLNRPLLAACILLNTGCTIAVLLIWLISVKPSEVKAFVGASNAAAKAEVITNRNAIARMEEQWRANKAAIEALKDQSHELSADIRRLLVTLIEQAESK